MTNSKICNSFIAFILTIKLKKSYFLLVFVTNRTTSCSIFGRPFCLKCMTSLCIIIGQELYALHRGSARVLQEVKQQGIIKANHSDSNTFREVGEAHIFRFKLNSLETKQKYKGLLNT